MNCSARPLNPHDTAESIGAAIFIIIYVGWYGAAFIVYFACHFISDVRHSHEYRAVAEYFSTFDQINERQDILDRLTNEDWLRTVYDLYYADKPMRVKLVEEKAASCAQKYRRKLSRLRRKRAYYVSETFAPSTVISAV